MTDAKNDQQAIFTSFLSHAHDTELGTALNDGLNETSGFMTDSSVEIDE